MTRLVKTKIQSNIYLELDRKSPVANKEIEGQVIILKELFETKDEFIVKNKFTGSDWLTQRSALCSCYSIMWGGIEGFWRVTLVTYL